MLQDWLKARVQSTPDKVGLIVDGHTQWTFRQLDQATDAITPILPCGQHVALLMPNNANAIIVILALMRNRCTIVPLNTRMALPEIQLQLHQSDCAYLIIDQLFYDSLPYPIDSDKPYTILSLPEIDTAFQPKPITDSPLTLDSPFAIIHTSGTSGTPKGAVLTYNNVLYSAMSSAYHIGHLPDDRWLCVLPLYHVGGLSTLIKAILYGIVLDLRSKFELESINNALTHEPITLVSFVPTMLYRLLNYRTEQWNHHLRLILLGGAPSSPELLARCQAEQIPVATTYGLTEASSQVATTLAETVHQKSGTVGKALMFTAIKVVDEQSTTVPPGTYGEIVVRGQTVMQGYYGNPQATAKTLRDGWLHTGDIGYLDTDGDLFLVQRRSDLILSGGENVYPAEVEAILRKHPAVVDVAVVGVPDAEWGQRVGAVIVANDDSVVVDDLIRHCRAHLAGYKVPRVVRLVDSLPMTGSGKVQRPALLPLFEESDKP